jgi:hypothetical protein
VRFCQPSQRAKASIQKLAFSEPPTTIGMGANASNQMLVFEGCETGPYWESKATVPPLQLQRWHSAIFQMEPRCGSAHSGFLKLLPNPRTVLTNCSRGVIAAGTSDSQNWRQAGEGHYSSNEDTSVIVLLWLRNRSHCFWFSSVTHSLACTTRAGRGVTRSTENF